MPAHPDLAAAIAIYTRVPGVPPRPSRRDWAVAHHLLVSGVTLDTIRAAILLATVRRTYRPADDPLEPVRAFAYYKPLALFLHREPLDDGYLHYIAFKFRRAFPGCPTPLDPLPKTAARSQNAAHARRR